MQANTYIHAFIFMRTVELMKETPECTHWKRLGKPTSKSFPIEWWHCTKLAMCWRAGRWLGLNSPPRHKCNCSCPSPDVVALQRHLWFPRTNTPASYVAVVITTRAMVITFCSDYSRITYALFVCRWTMLSSSWQLPSCLQSRGMDPDWF